jgi:hypothetical protein
MKAIGMCIRNAPLQVTPVGGKSNIRSTWDYASDFHCYVNGYFTDGKCTMGKYVSYTLAFLNAHVLSIASLGSCSACYPNC